MPILIRRRYGTEKIMVKENLKYLLKYIISQELLIGTPVPHLINLDKEG